MNVALWILQILLGALFLAAGIGKLTQPPEKLQKNLKWIEDVTPIQLRGIGLVEVLGGLGLILPWALDIARWLTPVAAVGLGIVMVLGAALHAKRHEYKEIGFNAILLIIAVVVAVGRF